MADSKDKLDGGSKDVLGEHKELFLELFPEVLSEGKVDVEKLKKTLGDEVVEDASERYNFTWAGKSGVYDALSRQTTKTLRPDKGESKNWDETDNIFVEGENLEVLKILQKSYYSAVKMIYIDPPYNTGKDFVYRDNFRQSQKQEMEAAGELDEDGKLKEGLVKNHATGRYHSNWLNMMYPRLALARNLLRDDGVIFVSIDDNEVHNLRMIMNEIFGEENFVVQIIWEKVHTRKNSAKYFSYNHDYVLCYAKSKENWDRNLIPREDTSAYKNPDDDPKGPWKADPITAHNYYAADYKIEKPNGVVLERPQDRYWAYSKESWDKKVEENAVVWGEGDSYPMIKRYLSEVQQGLVPQSIFPREFAGDSSEAKSEVDEVILDKGFFDYPKPTKLIRRLSQIGSNSNTGDIIMDFFTGSGTTAHAVMAQNAEDGGNRQCISVQLPEETPEDSEARKAGYQNIAEIARERIRRAGEKIVEDYADDEDFDVESFDAGFKAYTLGQSNFTHWRAEEIEDEGVLQQKLEDAIETKGENAEELAMVYEIMLTRGLSLTSEIEDKDEFYRVKDTAICLHENVGDELADRIIDTEVSTAVFLESGFANDEVKTNTALQLKDADVTFKVI